MTPIRDIVPHRLKGNVSVSCQADPINLTWRDDNAGGYSSAEWDTYEDPPAVGEKAIVISEGVHSFEGRVDAVSDGVGERKLPHVVCYGNADDLKGNETMEGVFVDRDLTQWQIADCRNWQAAPDFEIAAAVEGSSLLFAWPETDKLMVDRSESDAAASTDVNMVVVEGTSVATHYNHIGNGMPPGWSRSHFAPPKILWTMAYYKLAGGATTHRITGLAFDAYWDLSTPKLDAKKTPDYNNPIGPPDEKYGHRFATYPKVNYWTDFAGIPLASLRSAFCGVYCCDSPGDLPVTDPQAMRQDPHLLHKFDARSKLSNRSSNAGRATGDDCGERTGGEVKDPLKMFLPCDGKMICVYAAYLAVQVPMNLGHRYSENADHLVRTKWVAVNRLFAEPGQFVELRNVSVYSQGYRSKDDGSDDLADVFEIAFPGCEVESMPLPGATDDASPTSIAIRQRTSKLAAIPELLALYPTAMCWGIWEDGILKIEHDAGSVSLSDEPGVDTTGAALSDEGAVDLVMVTYVAPQTSAAAVGSFVTDELAVLLVDKDGAATYPDDDWEPEEGQRVAHIDATGQAQSELAAARIGQLEAIARRRSQWTGTVTAKAIAGASTFRPGKTLAAPGIDGALITGVSVDVNSDVVTLSLGATGYRTRFPAKVPGRPLSAAPPGIPQIPGGPMMRRPKTKR